MRRVLLVAAALIAAAAPTMLRAQSAAAPSRVAVTLFSGAGGTLSLSQPGPDRAAGPAFVGGIELARPSAPGFVGRLALRAEGGFAAQDFAAGQGALTGDVHTGHAALALSVAFREWSMSRLVPYALGGVVWSRPSTRLILGEGSQVTPGARFEQVTHENVAGSIVGAGVAWQLQRAVVRAEARWMALATADRATMSLPLVLTLAIPLHR